MDKCWSNWSDWIIHPMGSTAGWYRWRSNSQGQYEYQHRKDSDGLTSVSMSYQNHPQPSSSSQAALQYTMPNADFLSQKDVPAKHLLDCPDSWGQTLSQDLSSDAGRRLDILEPPQNIVQNERSENAQPYTPGSLETQPLNLEQIREAQLDEEYHIPLFKNQKKEFREGSVFKQYWIETHGGQFDPKQTTFTIQELKNIKTFAEIRRFIVIKRRKYFSLCVCIQSYLHKGTTRKGVDPKLHCQAYTGDQVPRLLMGERNLGAKPVRIYLNSGLASDEFHTTSRINMGHIYTVHHNLPIRHIGRVRSQDLIRLQTHVWRLNSSSMAKNIDDVDEEEDDVDEEEDEGWRPKNDEYENPEISSADDKPTTGTIRLARTQKGLLEVSPQVQAERNRLTMSPPSASYPTSETKSKCPSNEDQIDPKLHFSQPKVQSLPLEIGDTAPGAPKEECVVGDADTMEYLELLGSMEKTEGPHYLHTRQDTTIFDESRSHLGDLEDIPGENMREADSDVDSVISEGSSVVSHHSHMSFASSIGPQSSQEMYLAQLIDLFCNDFEVYQLVYEASFRESIGREKLERNFHRLLKKYLMELRQEAKTTEQVGAIRFARTQVRSVSKGVCSRCAQDSDHTNSFIKKNLGTEGNFEEEIESDLDDGNDDEDQSEDEYDLNLANEFFRSSWAFCSFRNNLKDFVYPTFQSKLSELSSNLKYSMASEKDIIHVRHVISELHQIEPKNIKIYNQPQTAWQDRAKSSIEDLTREKWDWWPLEPPRLPSTDNSCCIEWTCTCKEKRWEQVPKSFAEGLSQIIRRYGHVSSASQQHDSTEWSQNQPKGDSVIQKGKGKAVQYQNNNHDRQLPSSTTSSSDTLHPGKSFESNCPERVLLVVRNGTNRLSQISLQNKDTTAFFHTLRSEYLRLRGWWRRLFSIWRYHHCEFYQFERFDSHEYAPRKSDDFPEPGDLDYRYLPKPMKYMPPITAHEFKKRFYSLSSRSIFHFHKCEPKNAHCRERLQVLPKKLSQLDESSSVPEPFWGMYAREVICFRWVMFYNIISFLPAFVFLIVSMLRFYKLQDLQDPSVPFGMSAAMLSIFWSQFIASLEYGGKRI